MSWADLRWRGPPRCLRAHRLHRTACAWARGARITQVARSRSGSRRVCRNNCRPGDELRTMDFVVRSFWKKASWRDAANAQLRTPYCDVRNWAAHRQLARHRTDSTNSDTFGNQRATPAYGRFAFWSTSTKCKSFDAQTFLSLFCCATLPNVQIQASSRGVGRRGSWEVAQPLVGRVPYHRVKSASPRACRPLVVGGNSMRPGHKATKRIQEVQNRSYMCENT